MVEESAQCTLTKFLDEVGVPDVVSVSHLVDGGRSYPFAYADVTLIESKDISEEVLIELVIEAARTHPGHGIFRARFDWFMDSEKLRLTQQRSKHFSLPKDSS